MINRIIDISLEHSKEQRKDPELVQRMEMALHGQSPRFLMISPINRSTQDLQLFGMLMGDVFHGTRVPNQPLLPHEKSPILFGGPAAYIRQFQGKKGIILTFDQFESEEIVKASLDNLVKHPDIGGLPILAFRVDYDQGRARIIPHGKGRDYETENRLLAKLRRPGELDEETLVLLCSDSRVHPPTTPRGNPMAILTLGGYVPRYSKNDESEYLSSFFSDWLSEASVNREIIIIAHGNFEGEGPSCGAGQASLSPESINNPILRVVVSEIRDAASAFEQQSPTNAEDRVKALSLAIKKNLLSYPAVQSFSESKTKDFIDILLMDTISNSLSMIDL